MSRFYFPVKTYHNHPDTGTLQLGNILTDHHRADEPLYRGPSPSPPLSLASPPDPSDPVRTESWQTSVKWTRERMRAGRFGIFTKFLAVFLGAGVDAGVEWDKSEKATYEFDRVDTKEFRPSDAWVAGVLSEPIVARVVDKGARTLYVVTGVKVVTGAKIQMERRNSRKVTFGAEIDPGILSGMPGGVVQVGPEVKLERGPGETDLFEATEPFVFAYRLQMIRISKLGRGVKRSDYVKDAMFVVDEERRRKKEPMVSFELEDFGQEEEDAVEDVEIESNSGSNEKSTIEFQEEKKEPEVDVTPI